MEKKNSLTTKLKANIGRLFERLHAWYRKSSLKTFLDKIAGWIVKVLSFIFYPLIKLYNNLRFEQKKVFMALLFLSPVIIGFVTFYLYPLATSFIYSFSSFKMQDGLKHFAFRSWDANGQLVFNPWQNYYFAFRVNINFMDALLNTIWTTIVNTIVITIFSLLMAVLLNGKYRGRTFIRAVFFLPVIFNSAAIDVAMSGVDAIDGLLSSLTSGALQSVFNIDVFLTSIGIPAVMVTFLGTITNAIYSTISYSGVQILIFLAAIQSVPKHLYEAAKVEGATGYEMFWKITLPLVSPMILTVVVYSIIDSFLRSEINDIIATYVINSEYGYHAAMSWSYIFASVIIVVVFVGILSRVVFYQDEKN